MQLPFAISPEAEDYLRERLNDDWPEAMEPSLGLIWGSDIRDADGELVERLHEEHYALGFSPPSRHEACQYYEFSGFRLAIHPHTTDSLRGKRLSVRDAVVSVAGADRKRSFVVATAVEDEPRRV